MPPDSALLPPRLDQVPRLAPDLCDDAALVLCDLDGCLIAQGRAFDDAPAFVETCGERLWIISNNSTDTAESLSRSLADLGIAVPAERILLSGEQTVRHLARTRPDARLTVYAGPRLRAAANALGFSATDGLSELALLCRDPNFTLASLDRLVADIEQGAELWVSNTDIFHPGFNGQRIAETGALLAAVRAILPKAAYRCLGKPDPFLLAMALRSTGTDPHRSVFVGDNASTDGDAACAANVPFIHLVRGRNPS